MVRVKEWKSSSQSITGPSGVTCSFLTSHSSPESVRLWLAQDWVMWSISKPVVEFKLKSMGWRSAREWAVPPRVAMGRVYWMLGQTREMPAFHSLPCSWPTITVQRNKSDLSEQEGGMGQERPLSNRVQWPSSIRLIVISLVNSFRNYNQFLAASWTDSNISLCSCSPTYLVSGSFLHIHPSKFFKIPLPILLLQEGFCELFALLSPSHGQRN